MSGSVRVSGSRGLFGPACLRTVVRPHGHHHESRPLARQLAHALSFVPQAIITNNSRTLARPLVSTLPGYLLLGQRQPIRRRLEEWISDWQDHTACCGESDSPECWSS
jgi:hypothetical protein